MVEARVTGVENAKTVFSWLNLKKRCDFTVDTIQVAVELLDPDRVLFRSIDDLGIVEGTIVVKETVLKHQRNLEFVSRQVERLLCFVAHQIKAGQTGVDVEPGDTKGMIVVPERGRGLTVWVRRGTRVELRASFAMCGEPRLWVAVVLR